MTSLVAALVLASSSGFVDRGAHEIHYERMGQGKPMVAIPGGPGFGGRALWSIGWEFQDVCDVILFDQLGTGLSRMKDGSRPKVTLAKTVADLDALRAKLGHKKWTVFGQSWGAIAAVAYAIEHPERVDRLVLASIPAFQGADFSVLSTNLMMRIGPEKMADLTLEARKAKTPAEAATIQVFGVTPYYFASVETGVELAKRTPDSLFDGQTFLDLYPEISVENLNRLRDRAKRWKGPTLLVQGHQDPCGAAMPYRVREWLPQSHIEMIDGAGHFSFIESPEAFAMRVRPFLGVPQPPHYRYLIGPDIEAWRKKRDEAGWPFGYKSRG